MRHPVYYTSRVETYGTYSNQCLVAQITLHRKAYDCVVNSVTVRRYFDHGNVSASGSSVLPPRRGAT